MESGLGWKTVLPVLGIVKGLFGLFISHDGASVGRVEGERRVSRMGGVKCVARQCWDALLARINGLSREVCMNGWDTVGRVLGARGSRVGCCCVNHRYPVLPQGLLALVSSVMEGVEIERVIHVFILHFRLAVGGGMVTGVQRMDFSIPAAGNEGVLLHRVEIVYQERR